VPARFTTKGIPDPGPVFERKGVNGGGQGNPNLIKDDLKGPSRSGEGQDTGSVKRGKTYTEGEKKFIAPDSKFCTRLGSFSAPCYEII